MKDCEIERELALLTLLLSVDQNNKNSLIQKHIQKLRKLLGKIRELEKAYRKGAL